MRKPNVVALLALAFLAVGIAVVMTTTTTTPTAAQSVIMVGPCPQDPTCPGNTDKNPKASICHFDEGKPEGHLNCQNESSIGSHVGPDGHDRDYCAADTGGVCINIPVPTPTPTPGP